MGARFAYAVDVPDELRHHPFPPLMLISLVENAIKHGIEPSPAGGNISISAVAEDRGVTRQLAVSVIDDGVGLQPGVGGGVGLENIREQLAARYGAIGELSIRSRPAGGVAATIRVPCAEKAP
jgi:sensor histidine kinase YesM